MVIHTLLEGGIHSAIILAFRECVGDDLVNKWGAQFRKIAGAKVDETVLFSWITYKSRAHRDRVNKKVMEDPRLAKMMDPANMPFDMSRMAWAGFKPIVEA